MTKIKVLFVCVVLVLIGSNASALTCGDFNNDGTGPDIADLVYLVNYMFQFGDPSPYPPTADCNGDGQLDISDLICWVDWMFNDGSPPNCPFWQLDNHEEINDGCLEYPVAGKGTPGQAASSSEMDSVGYLYLEVVENDIHVFHIGAYYQCCLGYFVDYNQSGYEITGFEADIGDLCDCYCDFNLESVLYGLAPGEYIVTLIGINGDTVGTDTAVIGDGPQVIDYSDSGCLKDDPEGSPPMVTYSLSGDTLVMEHFNAFFNCGGIIAVEFEKADDTLRFYEINVSDDWAYCMCYFFVTATVVHVQPGTYFAEIYARDYPDDPMQLVDRRIIILD